MHHFIFYVLVACVRAAKRSPHGNRKIAFDYAVKCIVEEMKRKNRYDLYLQARRVMFISSERTSVVSVVEYFGYSWSEVTKKEILPPTCNTGVTPSDINNQMTLAIEEHTSGSY